MSNEISLIPQQAEFTVLKEVAAMALRSGLLPQTIKTPEQAVIIALKGREIGMPPMQAFASIVVISGKPTISSEGMLALIYKNQPKAQVVFVQSDASGCVIKAKRPGGEFSQFSFTMQDAQKADLLRNQVWSKYPAAMCRARCISAMARAMFPDCLMGVSYTAEELGGEANEEDVVDVVQTRPNEVVASIESAKQAVERVQKPSERLIASASPLTPSKPKETSIEPLNAYMGASKSADDGMTKPQGYFTPTEAQLKRLFAKTKAAAWTPEEVTEYSVLRWTLKPNQLSKEQYDELCAMLDTKPNANEVLSKLDLKLAAPVKTNHEPLFDNQESDVPLF